MGVDRRTAAGAAVFGFGLGGLLDVILLHHVLQWHNLVSSVVDRETLSGLERNLFWDGVFHLATTALLVAGVVLLRHERAGRAPLRSVAGVALVGWGAFHVVDQLAFHLALELHHIRMDAASRALYDWGFFGVGLVLAAAGALLLRRSATA